MHGFAELLRFADSGPGQILGSALHAAFALAGLALDCETIVGRRGEIAVGDQRLAGFSLMLHGLSAEQSLTAQAHGIGLHRKLGCGVFVPHKSVAAVGL